MKKKSRGVAGDGAAIPWPPQPPPSSRTTSSGREVWIDGPLAAQPSALPWHGHGLAVINTGLATGIRELQADNTAHLHKSPLSSNLQTDQIAGGGELAGSTNKLTLLGGKPRPLGGKSRPPGGKPRPPGGKSHPRTCKGGSSSYFPRPRRSRRSSAVKLDSVLNTSWLTASRRYNQSVRPWELLAGGQHQLSVRSRSRVSKRTAGTRMGNHNSSTSHHPHPILKYSGGGRGIADLSVIGRMCRDIVLNVESTPAATSSHSTSTSNFSTSTYLNSIWSSISGSSDDESVDTVEGENVDRVGCESVARVECERVDRVGCESVESGECDRFPMDESVEKARSEAVKSVESWGMYRPSTSQIYMSSSVTSSVHSQYDLDVNRSQLKIRVYMHCCMLTVAVIRGSFVNNTLPVLSSSSSYSTHIKVSLLPDNSSRTLITSTSVKNTLQPEYNEIFTYELLPEDRRKRLLVSAWFKHKGFESNTSSRQRNTGSVFFGCMSFGINRLVSENKTISGWFYLLSEDIGRRKHQPVVQRGELSGQLSVSPFDADKTIVPRSEEFFGKIFSIVEDDDCTKKQTVV